jgi:hypothetical protein
LARTRPVISASRRTDIPAWYTPWFMDGIHRGQVQVINPFNRIGRAVDLRPEAVHSIVLWSKNFGPFLDAGAHTELDRMGYRLLFNFTVNAPNPVLEPNIPGLGFRLDQVRTLCRSFCPEQINWRFDPISFYEHNGVPMNTLEGFSALARAMADMGIRRCITSFYDPYRKVAGRIRRMAAAGGPVVRFADPGMDTRQQVIRKMADLLAGLGIRLFLCCEAALAESLAGTENLSASACIDGHLLQDLFGGAPVKARDSGQRRDKGCQCTRSIDIGSYDLHPCPHNCLFCYARTGMDQTKQT